MSLIEPIEKKFPFLALCPSLFSRLVMALSTDGLFCLRKLEDQRHSGVYKQFNQNGEGKLVCIWQDFRAAVQREDGKGHSQQLKQGKGRKGNPTKKELEKLDREMEQLDKKKNKLFDEYEEEILSSEEFKERKEMLNKRTQELLEQKQPLLETLEDTVTDEIPYDYLKSITINEQREIDSIKLKISDSLVNYMNKKEGVSIGVHLLLSL